MLNSINHGKKRWVLISLAYAGVIFFLSTLPAGHSRQHSLWKEIARNLAHIPLYGVLGVLVVRALNGFIGVIPTYALTIAIGIAVGCADEYVQSFSSGRTVSAGDVLLDFIGISLAIVLVHNIKKIMSGGCGHVTGGRNG
jgi:VanZ family protein